MIASDLEARLLVLDPASQVETAGWLIDLLDGADPGAPESDSVTEALERGRQLSNGEVRGLSKAEFCEGLRHG